MNLIQFAFYEKHMTDRQKERRTGCQMDRPMDGRANQHTGQQTDRQTDGPKDGPTDGPTDGQKYQ